MRGKAEYEGDKFYGKVCYFSSLGTFKINGLAKKGQEKVTRVRAGKTTTKTQPKLLFLENREKIIIIIIINKYINTHTKFPLYRYLSESRENVQFIIPFIFS